MPASPQPALDVAGSHQQATLPFLDDLQRSAVAGGDDGFPAGHGFDEHQSERLRPDRWQHQDIERGVQPRNPIRPVPPLRELHIDPELTHEGVQARGEFLPAVHGPSGNDESCVRVQRGSAQKDLHSLPVVETGDHSDDEVVVVEPEFPSHARSIVGRMNMTRSGPS
jgi:hypothetical protein